MAWVSELIDRLAEHPCCGYGATDSHATEPTALAAMALAGDNEFEPAHRAGEWLKRIQTADGSVGIREGEPRPAWPTSLATLAWRSLEASASGYRPAIDRAVGWILRDHGETMPREEGLGHDPSLVAWSWVPGTHAWVEPTALHVLALKCAGLTMHVRTRSAVQMLLNRQLPRGGCNYGNTFVLDQPLRAHVQPTALALLALAGEFDPHGRIRQSLLFLRNQVSAETSTTSLCWSLLAMAAHDVVPDAADQWLEAVYHKVAGRSTSPLKLALLALAAQKQTAFLVKSAIHESKSLS